ncbi:Brp/Blh family beta-carotene 15,15'-dioxygenase [Candidatus Pelagibacter sp.]|nr:Brp/Blh family beta-carotene 15,15'-dioxygenase [Candidatus Pelagibacter sp.]
MNTKFNINLNISFAFFLLSLILGFLKIYNHLSKDFLSVIACLFLILTIGVSHGALDDLKGYKLLKFYKINIKLLFFVAYILISFLIIIIWILVPTLMLIFFLIVASYHFGKEDSWGIKLKKSNFYMLIFFLKGSLIISAPLLFSFNETLTIFDTLGVKDNRFYSLLNILNNNHILLSFVIISIISNFLITQKLVELMVLFIDTICILILYYSFNPLIAFTIYFCFLHSIRHSASLITELKINLNSFIKKALPLTIITAFFFLMGLYVFTGFQSIDVESSIIAVIFIGLASLTFPHILLEYLIEKNEK